MHLRCSISQESFVFVPCHDHFVSGSEADA